MTNLGSISIATSQGSISTTPGTGSIITSMIADDNVTQAKMANDSVGSAELKSVVSLSIFNSAGTLVKRIYGAGGA
jgi:hypothetical protein